MRKILIIAGRYLPGFRDGGPVRSILNLTEWMGYEADIRIMCLDRDHGDTKRYPDIRINEYNSVGKAKVWYTPAFTKQDIIRLSDEADVVYVCGPYSDYARIAMRLKKEGKMTAPLYVASMGSFSPEAFRIKGLKKKLFIYLMKSSGMFDDVTWSVTSKREEAELKAVVGKNAKCVIATDLPRRDSTQHDHEKESGALRLVFISRISRKKNLSAVYGILKSVSDDIRIKLDIYGTAEDKAYLHECMALLDDLKKTHPLCKWEYKGEADSMKVPEILAHYDAMIFPTLGENYGHVIAESLSSGCIPVISDTTPWLDLDENGCGYVCPLGDNKAFSNALNKLAAMDDATIEAKRKKSYEYINKINERTLRDSGYRKIFA